MKIRQSNSEDLATIMDIISDAQMYLAKQNIDQWQDGYPNEAQILLDISNRDSYVVTNENEEIIGTSVCTTKHEITYDQINGKWLTDDNAEYGVIHRIAVSEEARGKGLAKFVFDYYENILQKAGIKSFRVDTHKNNVGMQKLLTNLGYQYCGIITLTSGAKRLAFEKLIQCP